MQRPRLVILTLTVLLNLLAWSWMKDNRSRDELTPFHVIKGVSYSPFRPGQSPLTGVYPTPDQIEEDMRVLEGKAAALRTYGSTRGLEAIAPLAARHHLRVTLCAWIDDDQATNEREIQSVIHLANANTNVDAVLIGNEAVLRADQNPDRAKGDRVAAQVASIIRRVRPQVHVPVSCAETFDVFIRHPDLARECDFLAAHFLPYWEGAPIEAAVKEVVGKHDYLQSQFPSKRIVMTEVGWPTGGDYKLGAVPSRWNQERFLREFLAAAQRNRFDYYVCEAFDQPWKADEGAVGRYWGLWDAQRQPKFNWPHPTPASVSWAWQFGISTTLGVLAIALLLRRRNDLHIEGHLFLALTLQACISLLTCTGMAPGMAWLTDGARTAWIFLFPTQILMLGIVVIQAFEMAELLWLKRRRRSFAPVSPLAVRPDYPKVSIHVPCCNEPPAMVIRLLESLAALNYPDFEVLVIDNNTTDEGVWRPLQDHCQSLGSRFRFFHLEKWPGFKAGALNYALSQTAGDARIIGVVDADYVVDPNWLRATVPHFDDPPNPNVGFVQCPQDHREWDRCGFKEMCNWEYAGFFQIGMVHRNERDAIIQHGTMTLISREALEKAGRWGEWCIVEDAELGLRLMSLGYHSVYVNQPLGHGVVPDSFLAYKKQRFRWAYGAVQVLREHWRMMLPWPVSPTRQRGSECGLPAGVALQSGSGVPPLFCAEEPRDAATTFQATGNTPSLALRANKTGLTPAQKYHFIAGWLPWFGDSLHLLFTLALLLWSAGMVFLPNRFMAPVTLFVSPALLVGLFSGLRSIWLYTTRVQCTPAQRIGAWVAGLALTYTIGRACITGLLTRNQPFFRTPKCEQSSNLLRCVAMARDEFALMVLLWAAIAGIMTTRNWNNAQTLLWIAGLAFQSVPYAAAVFCSLVAGMPALNETMLRFGASRAGALARKPELAMSKA